jgi:rhodanese-related sulfurtransferase
MAPALVGVVPRQEFEQEHLPGAINLPREELRPDSAVLLLGEERRRAIIDYCQATD